MITNLAESTDEDRVVFTTFDRIFSIPVSGGAATLLHDAPGYIHSFQVGPDPRWVVFHKDRDLFGVPIDGSAAARRMHPELVNGGWVLDYHLCGNHVVYRADLESDDVFELYLSYLGSVERPPMQRPAPTRSVLR